MTRHPDELWPPDATRKAMEESTARAESPDFEAMLTDPNEQFDLRADLLAGIDAWTNAKSGTMAAPSDVRSRHVVGDDDHRLDDDELERLIRAFSEPDEELGWRGSKSLRLLAHEIAGYIADHYSKPLPMAERDALRAEAARLRAGLADLAGQYIERVETLRRTEAALAEERAKVARVEAATDATQAMLGSAFMSETDRRAVQATLDGIRAALSGQYETGGDRG